MKHNKNHDNAKSAGPELVPVHFEFTHPTARTVCIAGTFDKWQPDAKPMHSMGDGRWIKETVLPPGTYEYCLVVDGNWIPDPKATETVANPFGGRNSVLRVANATSGISSGPCGGGRENSVPVTHHTERSGQMKGSSL